MQHNTELWYPPNVAAEDVKVIRQHMRRIQYDESAVVRRLPGSARECDTVWSCADHIMVPRGRGRP